MCTEKKKKRKKLSPVKIHFVMWCLKQHAKVYSRWVENLMHLSIIDYVTHFCWEPIKKSLSIFRVQRGSKKLKGFSKKLYFLNDVLHFLFLKFLKLKNIYDIKISSSLSWLIFFSPNFSSSPYFKLNNIHSIASHK